MITKDTFRRGFKNGFTTIYELAKVIIPVYMIITILKYTFVLNMISEMFQPLMKIFGLPGEAALPIVLGNILSFYAGIGAIASLTLTAKQITIISVILSFSHSLPMETAVASKIGVDGKVLILIRVGLATASGILLNIVI